ncbi:MAG: 16S rRNA (cytosine(967)-C(5))-methyltransferase RsmB [Saccharofermentans sp.]|nr:16S rRNA (cytosine(967)-C(5))-methyltransferase RsmB [Saccharofermentans sp.]
MDDRELCISIIHDCFEKEAFTNLALSKTNASDFVRAAVYGTVTYVYAEDYLIKKVAGKDVSQLDPIVRTILRFGVWQIVFSEKVPDYAAVNTSVDLCKRKAKRAVNLVNAVLRKISDLTPEQRDLSSCKEPEAAFSLKSEVYGVIKKGYGKERAPIIARALLNSAPLSIRVNTLKTTANNLKNSLELEGFKLLDSSYMPDSFVLIPTGESPSIANSISFKNGEFIVQGEGAQLASLVAEPKANMRILDCCAAPGGKSTHMAQLANDKCEIVSLDVNDSRLKLINENASRLGITSIRTQNADASAFSDDEGFDLVLCDAPCSGLGIMGGKPDIRYTITYQRILECQEKQSEILNNIKNCVKPGGTLVYSTCTINPGENEDMVRSFLEANNDFEVNDFKDLLPQKLKDSYLDGMITLLPDKDSCEGFFISRLRRKK